jgi:hypothetical protein
LAFFQTAKAYGSAPFPGAVTEWETEDFAFAYAALILMDEAEAKAMKDSRESAEKEAEEKAERDRLKRIHEEGGIAGGGAPLPRERIETPLLEDEED